MNIAYIANARIPTEKAYGYQIAKMCEAFASAGHDLTLIAPTRTNNIGENLHEYYGVSNNFKLIYLKSHDWSWLRRFIGEYYFYLNSIAFFMKCFFLKLDKSATVYTRNPELAWLFAKRGYRTFFECHQMPNKKSWLFNFFIKPVTGIIAITQGLKSDIVKRYDYPSEKILVAPDGVDLETFDIDISREDARQKLGLPIDKKITLYTGHLYTWKGVDTLAQAAASLPPDTLVYVVGGTKEEIKLFKQRNSDTSRIINVAARPRNEIAIWLKAADVLILPNSSKEAISEKYTSPLKLFEYMASGTPIIASNLPSLREIIDDNLATLYAADTPLDLNEKINYVLQNPALVLTLANKARQSAKTYSWKNRAAIIISKIYTAT